MARYRLAFDPDKSSRIDRGADSGFVDQFLVTGTAGCRNARVRTDGETGNFRIAVGLGDEQFPRLGGGDNSHLAVQRIAEVARNNARNHAGQNRFGDDNRTARRRSQRV